MTVPIRMEAIGEDLYVLSDELQRLGRIHPWSCLGNLKFGSGREHSFLFIKLCRFDPGQVSVLRLAVPASPPAQVCQYTFMGWLMGCYTPISEQPASDRWMLSILRSQKLYTLVPTQGGSTADTLGYSHQRNQVRHLPLSPYSLT